MADGLLIVGNRGSTHVGASFERAALESGREAMLLDAAESMRGPRWRRWISWHLGGRRPLRLDAFGGEAAARVAETRPSTLLATGFAPLGRAALKKISAAGCRTLNYLTDDPWNRAQHSPWLLEALPEYSVVFTTRTANEVDLRKLGCRDVRFLPFAYDPALFFPETAPEAEKRHFESDLFFAGGADPDRVPYIDAARAAGLDVALYGGLWERYPSVARLSRGIADTKTIRHAVSGSKVALCLVRRANRDGHSMRTFEVPAAGGCPLLEDTEEHRAMFGPDGEAAVYFKTPREMAERAARLAADAPRRRRIAAAAHALVTLGKNTYADRLEEMLR